MGDLSKLHWVRCVFLVANPSYIFLHDFLVLEKYTFFEYLDINIGILGDITCLTCKSHQWTILGHLILFFVEESSEHQYQSFIILNCHDIVIMTATCWWCCAPYPEKALGGAQAPGGAGGLNANTVHELFQDLLWGFTVLKGIFFYKKLNKDKVYNVEKPTPSVAFGKLIAGLLDPISDFVGRDVILLGQISRADVILQHLLHDLETLLGEEGFCSAEGKERPVYVVSFPFDDQGRTILH